jgi:hypothetical protein
MAGHWQVPAALTFRTSPKQAVCAPTASADRMQQRPTQAGMQNMSRRRRKCPQEWYNEICPRACHLA